MNTKNYFLTAGVLNLLFGFSLVFLPSMMTDQFITDPSLRNSVTDFTSKLYGVNLIAIAIIQLSVTNAGPSPFRKAFIIGSCIANFVSVPLHIMAINEGIEKSFAWGTVVILLLMGIWGLLLLRSNK